VDGGDTLNVSDDLQVSIVKVMTWNTKSVCFLKLVWYLETFRQSLPFKAQPNSNHILWYKDEISHFSLKVSQWMATPSLVNILWDIL
jgi:hypothetical protein